MIGFIDSGIGQLPYALAVRRLLPNHPLVLSLDPDYMPWGDLTTTALTERTLTSLELLLSKGADVVVIACNTASVHALPALRDAAPADVPIVGTVPAVKVAARGGLEPTTVWATPATVGSDYMARLIRAAGLREPVQQVSCPDLAAAIESGEPGRLARALAAAVAETNLTSRSVVLGCTHYSLVREAIAAAIPHCVILDSTEGVARQVARLAPAVTAPGATSCSVFSSGRQGQLPEVSYLYGPFSTAL